MWWIIIGLILVIGEFMVPGAMLVIFGSAAILVGLLSSAGILQSLPMQIVVFAILSIALLIALWRIFSVQLFGDKDQTGIAPDGPGLVGQRAVVLEPFKKGLGIVSFRGAQWQAQSSAVLEKDQVVRIVSSQGLCVTVVPYEVGTRIEEK